MNEKNNGDGVVKVALAPSLTIDTVEHVASELATRSYEGGVIEIDAHALENLTTPGLQLLLAVQASATRAGGQMRITGLSPSMHELCTLFGVGELLAQWTSPSPLNASEDSSHA